MGRILLALCGLVVALSLSGAQAQENQGAGSGQGTEEAQPQIPDSDGLSRIAGAIEEAARNPYEGDEQRRAEKDLRAQETMASWARWVTVAAFLQVVVGLFGIHYLRVTIRESRHAASLAITEAKATAKAANDAVEVSRQQMVADRRPWMAPKRLALVQAGTNHDLAFDFAFENTGNSPAFDTKLCIAVDIDDRLHYEVGYRKFLTAEIQRHRSGKTFFPGERLEEEIHIPFSRRAVKALANRRKGAPRKPDGLSPRLYYVVLYRSTFVGRDGRRELHHTGGIMQVYRLNGLILPDALIPVDELRMFRREIDSVLSAS